MLLVIRLPQASRLCIPQSTTEATVEMVMAVAAVYVWQHTEALRICMSTPHAEQWLEDALQ